MLALQVTVLGSYEPQQECFFQLLGQNLSNGADVRLVFKNNSADAAGSVLYGGAIDNCKLTYGLDSHSSSEVFDMIVYNNDTDYNTQLPQTHFKYACVKIIFQTVVRMYITFHTQYILVKCFTFLWLQLDEDMEQFLVEWLVS